MLALTAVSSSSSPSISLERNSIENRPSLYEEDSLFEKIRRLYISAVQSIAQFFMKHGYKIACYTVSSLFAEPLVSIKEGISRLDDWRFAWKRHDFHDANYHLFDTILQSSIAEEVAVEQIAQGDNYVPPFPVILLHGIYATPHTFLDWAPQLKKAQKNGRIGQVITLQLPNDMKERMEILRKLITKVCNIYQRVINNPISVNLLGHSLGGFSGHLAAFDSEVIYDQDNIQRRWHCLDKLNPQVNKVITIGGPTWLCCQGQTDKQNPENKDIYPLTGFDQEQIATIRQTHHNIYDIVGEEDAISPTTSPLSPQFVHSVRQGHCGAAKDEKVCDLALSLLMN